jgi:hypothetical protein
MTKLSSKELITIFKSDLQKSPSCFFLGGENPCHFIYDVTEYYVYVKNISSAYFDNPDVSRVQLTGVDVLAQIKSTNAMFVLIGYDADNDIYAVWNPYIVKQRIGTAASPSLYSRFSWQKEAGNGSDFISHDLKNDGMVLLFPRKRIADFMSDIDSYFPDNSVYVAMGSKRRKSANAAYKEFNSSKNISLFADLYASKLVGATPELDSEKENKEIIKGLFIYIAPQITKNRKLFLTCDSLLEYPNAIKEFLKSDDLNILDDIQMNFASVILPYYVEFLIKYRYDETMADENDVDEDTSPVTEEVNSKPVVPDYESQYIDENGILTKITNPELIELLREDLHTDYPNIFAAYATIEDFYGDRFSKMELRHWQKAFETINWEQTDNETKDETNPSSKTSLRQKLKVTLPNGRVLCDNLVVKTFLDVIKYAGVEEVFKLGMNGERGMNLIIKGQPTASQLRYKPLDDNNYVYVNTNTYTKYKQLVKINKLLQLGLQVELV